MVEVASSNLAGPTKHERARCKRAFLCLKGYHTLELAKPIEKRALGAFSPPPQSAGARRVQSPEAMAIEGNLAGPTKFLSICFY